jgi:SAM-dependent methyltransferase
VNLGTPVQPPRLAVGAEEENVHRSEPAVARAEFDQLADGYSAGMENPIKRLVGRTADDFIFPKVQWLLRDQQRRPLKSGCRDLLDLGCGTGRFLWHLQKSNFPARMHGCDVSTGMLGELMRRWDSQQPCPNLKVCPNETAIPFDDGAFDVVVTSAVLHHVAPTLRPGLIGEIFRVLAPGGRAYVFEHNPYHPLTRWVVQHTALDRNAVLLSPKQVRHTFHDTGFGELLTRYLLFLPPRWRWLRDLDRWLCWLPAGGQYVVSGEKLQG